MLISCTVTAQLICVFVFAYAKKRFSHNKAHITKQITTEGFSVTKDGAMTAQKRAELMKAVALNDRCITCKHAVIH